MFANRLRKNIKHIAKWAKKSSVDCYRVYDADIPEYAVAVDRYDQWVHVQEYAPPKNIDESKAKQRLTEIMSSIGEILAVPEENIFLKVREKQKGKAQYEKLSSSEVFHTVREFNAEFLVNFEDYLDTGLFLDHRNTRKMIQEIASGKRFLNLFSYTGSASVHAALGQAKNTTTVDLSNTYLDWAKKNFLLNKMDLDQNKIIRADCLDWLRTTKDKYDLIFLDPPSFSNSKKMDQSFDVQRDHQMLLNLTMRHLEKDGLLIFSNNRRKFKMDPVVTEQYSVKNITHQSIPKDFARNPHIHNCWKIQYHE
jgi:23S rRNA (guanine2445-N2)-methyltransferase / 23S rRNA (guanine2069-N7)-methyltransferase